MFKMWHLILICADNLLNDGIMGISHQSSNFLIDGIQEIIQMTLFTYNIYIIILVYVNCMWNYF